MNRNDPVSQLAVSVERLQRQIDQMKTRGANVPEYANAANVLISNSVVETELFRRPIYADSLSTLGMLRLEIQARIANATAGAITATIRYKLGATTIVTLAASIPVGTQQSVYSAWLRNAGATNSQFVAAEIRAGIEGTAGVSVFLVGSGTGAEDTTADKDLVITAQLSVASASATLAKRFAHLIGPM